ncbi:hypothetical protein CN553_28770 [Bacillus cereus]|uniref:Transposase IS4-like domain-containing protein n=2 Tax=Bacillus cereus TaxID=1396 RepID=A0A9X6U6B5_BACCE|nr:hypothetical protein CN553_28770 [Bacillus cereus]
MDERQSLCNMVDHLDLKTSTIILADRGYESFNVYEHINKSGYNYVIRGKDIKSNGFLSHLELPQSSTFDVTVELKLTRRQTKEIKSDKSYRFLSSTAKFDYLEKDSKDYYPIKLRVVRLEVEKGIYECLLTNLDANWFPPSELKTLYHLRWGIGVSR